jgi:hypothetical protein
MPLIHLLAIKAAANRLNRKEVLRWVPAARAPKTGKLKTGLKTGKWDFASFSCLYSGRATTAPTDVGG